jgi:UDP-glucose 4-epimerase
MYLNTLIANTDTTFLSLRLSNVFGYSRHQAIPSDGIILRWLTAGIKGKNLLIRNWNSKRDFIYAADVTRAFEASLSKSENGIYNIGSGVATSLKELFDTVQNCFEQPLKAIVIPELLGDIAENCLSIEKAKHNLGWEPRFSLIDGLIETKNELLQN